jgi:hypothetical protein
MMAARTITVWTEVIRRVLTHFSLKFKTSAHRLQNTFTVAADEQLVLPSARFVFMRSIIHAVCRILAQHRSPLLFKRDLKKGLKVTREKITVFYEEQKVSLAACRIIRAEAKIRKFENRF